MCGIVGLFLKDKRLQGDLGRLTGLMLRELCDRGPDSAGFAVYGGERKGATKICMVSRAAAVDWKQVAKQLGKAIDAKVSVEEIEDHAIFKTAGAGDTARKWLIDNVPSAYVLSQGHSIEIFKGVGNPAAIVGRLGLDQRAGTHAIGHTRMATESAVTVAGSHPFSTGDDTCLVHNGSLSNHNRLRDQLVRRGERFQTDNDSEVAAAYIGSRMRAGDTLKGAKGLPLNLLDALRAFEKATVLREGLGEDLTKSYLKLKHDDWNAYSRHLTEWERQTTLDC